MSKEKPGSWLSRVKKTLFSAESGEETETPDGSQARANGMGDEAWVPLSLDDLLKNQPTARLHMISLAEYRSSIGEAWKKRSKVILLLAETTLRGHLRPGETLFQADGGNVFILYFPKLSYADAIKRAMDAADHLGRKLVGEKFSDGQGEAPAVRLTSFSALDVANDDGELDAAALGKQAEKAERLDKVVLPAQSKPQAQTAPPAKQPAGGGAWSSLKHEGRQIPLDMVPIQPARKAKKNDELQWQPIEKKD